jgi:enediyne biosynthesis protein E4
MGADFADYNNDGKPDIFVNALSLQSYALFRNAGDAFEDESDRSGIARPSLQFSGWGTRFVDFDNDGWKDLFVGQGHVMDTISIDFPQISYKQKLMLLRNLQGKFTDVSGKAGVAFQAPLAARGAAFGDIDNDGRVDVVVSTNDGSPHILMNRSETRRHWIEVKLTGSNSNRDGIGARVRITTLPGRSQYGYVSTASSYLSASDVRLHFGLGDAVQVREIQVDWPNGRVQKVSNVRANQVIVITEPDGSP